MRVVVSTGWFAMWGTLAVILSAPACSAPKAAPSEAPPTIASPARASAATPSEAPSPSTAGSQTPAATTAAAIRYVAIGASDSVGVGASDPARGSWPSRVAALLPAGAVYMNVGVAGSLALQAEREQLPGAIAQHPTLVTVWLAVNDLNATIEPAAYAGALGAIVDGLARGTTATIFVGNVPDLRPVPAYAGTDKARLLGAITAYNDAIAGIAAQHPTRVVVVDLFTGSAALVSSATVSSDGFHPSDVGYSLIADRFAAAMRAKGVPLRG